MSVIFLSIALFFAFQYVFLKTVKQDCQKDLYERFCKTAYGFFVKFKGTTFFTITVDKDAHVASPQEQFQDMQQIHSVQ